MQHYAQVTEADTREAAESSILKGAENTVQTAAVTGRKKSHEIKDRPPKYPIYCGKNAEKTIACDCLRKADTGYPVGGIGLEPTTPCVSSRCSSRLS